jgi:glycosyltransferase involved in cell wall biosynthesis
MDNHFKIIIPLYNVEKWINKTIKSIQLQNYDNFQCIVIDDISTDNTNNKIQEMIKNDNRFLLIKNEEKKYPLENIRTAFNASNPSKEDIIVIVHGDDWLASPNVLTILDKEYKENDCWLTYGSYVEFPDMIRGKFSKKVPKNIIDNNLIRVSPWMTSHLHTFKYGLWKHIVPEKSFIESEQKQHHFYGAWDLAWMFPLFELAGHKSHFVKEMLYIYNRENPLNVDKVDHQRQLESENMLREMEKYLPLSEL